MIYIAAVKKGKLVKIGYSKDPSFRLSQLQTGNALRIELLAVVEGTLLQERAIHKAIRTGLQRIRLPVPVGEWYQGNHPFIKKAIENLKISANHALAYLDQYDPAVKQPGKDRRSNAESYPHGGRPVSAP